MTEIISSFRIMVEDLRRGRRFWIPVAVGILPAILAAMTVSLNFPRLLVRLTVDNVTYVTRKNPALDRPTSSLILNGWIRDKISTQVDRLFSVASPAAGKEKGKLGPTNQATTGTNEKQPLPDITPTAKDSAAREAAELRATPLVANQGDKSVPELIGLFVKVPSRIKVTNIGSLASIIEDLRMSIVEEIDGRREILEQHLEHKLDIKLPQGQSVEVGGQQGKTVLFWVASDLFWDYETVRVLGERLRTLKPDEKSRYFYAIPFLELLGEDAEEREQLLRIGNPKVRSRLILVVEVWDIYGRQGSAEADLLDSRGWMQEIAGSSQK
jgi:hypothetical protein